MGIIETANDAAEAGFADHAVFATLKERDELKGVLRDGTAFHATSLFAEGREKAPEGGVVDVWEEAGK